MQLFVNKTMAGLTEVIKPQLESLQHRVESMMVNGHYSMKLYARLFHLGKEIGLKLKRLKGFGEIQLTVEQLEVLYIEFRDWISVKSEEINAIQLEEMQMIQANKSLDSKVTQDCVELRFMRFTIVSLVTLVLVLLFILVVASVRAFLM